MRREAVDDANGVKETLDVNQGTNLEDPRECDPGSDGGGQGASQNVDSDPLAVSPTVGGRRKSSRRLVRKSGVCTPSTPATVAAEETCEGENEAGAKVVNVGGGGKVSTSRARTRQVWTNVQTTLFYEALAEHGKDFSKIQAYIAQTGEKKGLLPDLVKDKEKVRNLYYRIRDKIAKLGLRISEDVDKHTQELYCVINYGEIWKKCGDKYLENKKNLTLHLNELILKGHTLIKAKCKNVKVKTPVCNALKKRINSKRLEEPSSSGLSSSSNLTNLPNDIYVEFHPANNAAWLRVHALAQNPRIRTRVCLQKRLSVLINYLEKRWSSSRHRKAEVDAFVGNSAEAVPLVSSSTASSRLRVRLDPKSISSTATVVITRTPAACHSQTSVSLSAFIKKNCVNGETKENKKKHTKTSHGSKSKSIEDNCMESESQEQGKDQGLESEVKQDPTSKEEDAPVSQKPGDEDDDTEVTCDPPISKTVAEISILQNMLASADCTQREDCVPAALCSPPSKATEETVKRKIEAEDGDEKAPADAVFVSPLLVPPADTTISQWLANSIESDASPKDETKELETVDEIKEDTEMTNKSETQPFVNSYQKSVQSLSPEAIEKGWTANDTNLTLGELYIMLKCPDKLCFRYEWDLSSDLKCMKDEEEGRDQSQTEMAHDASLLKDDSVLCKLLMTANMALINMNKQTVQPQQQSGSPVKSERNNMRKNKRVKSNSPTDPTLTPTELISEASSQGSSHLLSSVISSTILNTTKVPERPLGEDREITALDSMESVHSFAIPTSPAPKAVGKKRIICDDKGVLQKAIKELTASKLNPRKHVRKPLLKQPYTQKPLLPRCLGLSSGIAGGPSPSTLLPAPVFANQVVSRGSIHVNTAVPASLRLPIVLSQPQQALSHIFVTQESVPVTQVLPHNTMAPVPSVITCPVFSPETSHSSRHIISQSLVVNHQTPHQPSNCLLTSSETDLKLSTHLNNEPINNSDLKDKHDKAQDDPRRHTSVRLSASPPNFSSLLDISLGESPRFNDNSCSSLSEVLGPNPSKSVDSGLESGNNKRPFSSLMLSSDCSSLSFSTDCSRAQTDPLVSALSPSNREPLKVVPPPDAQWLNGDSSNLSLTSFFNPIESPSKLISQTLDGEKSSGGGTGHSSSLPSVDLSISSLVNDNSLDLVAKFADLASHVTEGNINNISIQGQGSSELSGNSRAT